MKLLSIGKSLFLLLSGLFLSACASAGPPPAVTSFAPAPTEAAAIQAAPITSEQPETAVPTSTPAPKIKLPDLGAAPEITNQVWLNSDGPLTLASVQGQKAVLLEFWTFD